jgi:hypothetical protein
MCKNEFEIELDISVKTKGLTVFRGRMDFLGNLQDVNALLDFIRDSFRDKQQLHKKVLINRLTETCGIPHSDACHFVEKLLLEGFMYEPKPEELVFIG